MLIMLLYPLWSSAQTQTERFDIRRFEISGNTLLPEEEIDALIAPYTGSGREYGDIQRALETLENAYRRRGYMAVQVYAPEQELTQGIIKLQVAETAIGKIVLPKAPRFFDAANLLAGLPALKEGTPPNALALSGQVVLNNENPAKQIDVVLGVGKTEATVDAKINLTESDPLRYFISLDNTGTHQTGEHRLTLGVQHANLWNRDHVATFAWTTSPEKPDLVGVGSLSYRVPLYAWASAIDFIYAKSNVDAGVTPTTAGPLTFTGKGDTFGLRFTHMLPRRGEYSARLIAGWDYKDYRNDCSLGVFGPAGCGSAAADVTLKPITVTYSGLRLRPGSATDYSLSLIRNMPGGERGDDAAFQAARPSPLGTGGARADYGLLRLSLSHLRILQGDWQLRIAGSGQWTSQPLLPQEQIGLAGSTAVRGFAEREVSRDQGLYANLEIYTPELAPHLGLAAGNLRLLAFYDFGTGSNNLLPGESQPKESLASAGAGLRYTLGKDINAKLDFARVTLANGNQGHGDVSGHFSLTVSF